MTFQVCLKERPFALDNKCHIMLTRIVDDIEVEARNLALPNRILGRRTVMRSYGSQG